MFVIVFKCDYLELFLRMKIHLETDTTEWMRSFIKGLQCKTSL